MFLALVGLLVLAHPVPKDSRDRTVLVRPTPSTLLVELRLEIDEGQAALDLPEEERVGVRDRTALLAAYARYAERLLLAGLDVTLDGRELSLVCTHRHLQVTDHVRLDFHFETVWLLKPQPQRLIFRESNFPEDSQSQLTLLFAPLPGVEATDLLTPPPALLSLKPEDFGPGDAERVRRIEASLFTVVPPIVPGQARPSLPPEMDPYKPAGLPRFGPRDKPAQGEVATASTHRPGVYQDSIAAEWDLKGLLESKAGLAALLLLAALFGAAHALTPGHGKTMVAAYLVGEKGTVWHALVLGITTTITHTASVLLVALALPWLFPSMPRASVQVVLSLVGGILVLGLGLWLLMQRLAGRADHVHLESSTDAPRWWQVITLGISGGIVPCYDAIGLLVVAVRLGALSIAVPLLLAFSAGLAAVLVAIGIGVVWTRQRMLMRGSDATSAQGSLGAWEPWVDRLGRWLPLGSATVLILLGLWMCLDAARLAT
jgi:ABC-type nickel/cobalt efflux system permease component RcnA